MGLLQRLLGRLFGRPAPAEPLDPSAPTEPSPARETPAQFDRAVPPQDLLCQETVQLEQVAADEPATGPPPGFCEEPIEADAAVPTPCTVPTEPLAQEDAGSETLPKASDLTFLGRGVSNGLARRTSRPLDLEALGLPVLHTPADVAAALGLTIPRLRWLAFHTEVARQVHYVRFEVPKRSGGIRVLHAPHRTLARAQRWIFEEILTRLPVHDAAHGFVSGRGTPSNAAPHAGQAVVVNCDLHDFFPSIEWPRVRAVFERLGYSPAVATVLALLCTECPRSAVVFDGTPYLVATGPRGLPQGACTSPALSNQVALRLDRRLSGLASRLGWAYTRYADDLTFSGSDGLKAQVGYLLARIRHIAGDEGFRVHEAKTRVLRRHTAQTVTGLVVNDRPRPPRSELRQLRAILHRARHEGLEAQNRAGRPDFRAWLLGKIAYVAMTDPKLAAKFRAEYEALSRNG